ncbi:MAG: PaaI family thioesterase [Alphaproteobacteria bacterium]|nr:PaaI family thioesterase [Alphaproteobacteria bacterium]
MAEAALAGLTPAVEQRVAGVLEVPLHRFLGFEATAIGAGAAAGRFRVGEAARSNIGMLHGGVLYSLLDATSYLALASDLAAGTTASTVDVSFSMLRPVAAGATVEMTARLDRLGRSLAFLQAEARVEGKLVAKAQLTKAVVTL